MEASIRQIVALTQHDPAAIIGFLLIGCAGVLSFHLDSQLTKNGYETSYTLSRMPFAGWDVTGRYLRACAKHGWSPWPAYLVWISAVGGVAVLILGLFRLHD